MKKRNVLLSSIITIALCLSVIAGSTFALFTDEKELDISVTSGNVEVDAKLDLVSTWSAEKATSFEDKYLVDEYGHIYNHIEQKPYEFINEGNAEIDADGKLVINKITPGDKVVAKIIVENVGNVSMIYRYKIVVDTEQNSALASGMVLTADNVVYESAQSFTSDWSGVVKADDAAIEHVFALELPVYAGNEYQSEDGDIKSVAYKVIVEAVQGNADMDADATPYEPIISVTNRDELQIALNNNQEAGKAYAINVLGDIVGDVTVVQKANVQYTIYGNGYTFDGALYINGRSNVASNVNATLTVKDFSFETSSTLGSTDAYINFGVKGDTNTRYVRGITVDGCSFYGNGLVAMRDNHNGNYDLTINDCYVDAGMHSLLQANAFDLVTVNNTVINGAEGGINLNNSHALEMNGCKFDIDGYAVRVGEKGGTANTTEKFFNITDCEFISDNAEDKAVIIVRDSSAFSTVTITDTTITAANGLITESLMPALTTFYEIHNP